MEIDIGHNSYSAGHDDARAAAATEIARLRAAVVALAEALSVAGRTCEDVHHALADQHGGEECPVEARILSALALPVVVEVVAGRKKP